MRTTLCSLAVPLLFFFSNQAFADGYARLGLLYLQDTSGYEGADNESTRTLIDIGAGYMWPKGWTLGALYGMQKIESGGGASSDRKLMGPTVGWIAPKDSGAYILGSYFISAERDDFKGTGYQVDLGYRFAISKIAFAPQISYRKITYDELGGAKIDPKYVDGNIDPYFVLWFTF